MSPRKSARGRRPRRRAATPHPEGLEARALLSTAQAPAPAGGPSYVPGEVLVQFKPGVGAAARAAARGPAAATLAESIQTDAMRDAGTGVMERLTLPADRSVDAAIRALQKNPNVAYAEPDWIYTHQDTSNDPYYTGGKLWGMYGDATTPANPYGSQAGEAWGASPAQTGSKAVYVGVIDEGIQYTHPDLDANAWNNAAELNGKPGVDDDGDGYVDDFHGWDFANNDNTIYDGGTTGSVDKHGTHVTGTIGAEGGNGTGVVGVNWNVTYVSAKFLGRFGGTTANAIKAVDYITTLKTHDGLNIVATNNSWGGGGFSQGLLDAITRAAKADILFIAAAGNNGSNNDTTANYPSNYDTTTDGASYDSVIAVAAIDSSGRLASFSDYGAKTVDIAAPGVGIYSTLPYNSYGSYDGTSMATPHVTGAAALYAAAHPGASAAEIRDAILTSAIPTASLAGKTATGGRLDVYGALTYNPTGPLVAPSGLQGTVLSSSQIMLSWADTNNNEKGYEIQQKIDGTFQTIAKTSVNATSYRVANLSPQTAYEFQVRAFNNDHVSDYSTVASATTARAVSIASSPYTDTFVNDPTTPGSVWAFGGTQWDYDPTSQILKQTSGQVTTVERRAMMVGVQEVPTEVKARVRVDEWKPGEYARAGVALATDPWTTEGYSLVFTGRQAASNQLGLNDGSGTRIEFVNDYVAWSGWSSQGGISVAFPIQVGGSNWYWFDMKLDAGKLYGKVWRDGTAEPAWPTKMNQATKISADAATITFDAAGHGWNRSGGVAALNGGYSGYFQSQDISYSKSSFDDVTAQIGAPVSGGKSGKPNALGAGAADVLVALAPSPVVSAGSPSGSGGDADPFRLFQAHPRVRRRWDGIRLS